MFLENPESERVARRMEENENLKEAVEKLDRISEDEKMQRIIELREKAIRDEHAIYAKGVDDGIEKGTKQIAKNLLKADVEIEVIIKATGLTKEEIEKLKKQLYAISKFRQHSQTFSKMTTRNRLSASLTKILPLCYNWQEDMFLPCTRIGVKHIRPYGPVFLFMGKTRPFCIF